MRLLIGMLFFLLLCACFVFMRPRAFFDDKGQPYGFGLTTETTRPYSLLIVFLAFAIVSYYLATMFYRG